MVWCGFANVAFIIDARDRDKLNGSPKMFREMD